MPLKVRKWGLRCGWVYFIVAVVWPAKCISNSPSLFSFLYHMASVCVLFFQSWIGDSWFWCRYYLFKGTRYCRVKMFQENRLWQTNFSKTTSSLASFKLPPKKISFLSLSLSLSLSHTHTHIFFLSVNFSLLWFSPCLSKLVWKDQQIDEK
jgi:hypothetical protein